MNLEQFVGWKLDEARAALSQDESTRDTPLCLVETAAPLRKNQTPLEQAAKLGEWRVLRAEVVHADHAQDHNAASHEAGKTNTQSEISQATIQLTVAREQLVD